MSAALLLLTAAAGSPSESDIDAALMFLQSAATPALMEVCTALQPDAAADYNTQLERWMKKNKRTIARGEQVARDQAKQDGTDVDAMIRPEIETMVSDLKALSVTRQRERCDYLIDVLRRES